LVAGGAAATRRRKFWGWGYEDEQPSPAEIRSAAEGIRGHLGFGAEDVELPVSEDDIDLPSPRLAPPSALADACTSDPYERASHSYGKSYSDIVRAFRGQFDHCCDVVAFPRDERELGELLEWCSGARAAAIPY
jgi:alkyldihydroxyacetonephosphate synthase